MRVQKEECYGAGAYETGLLYGRIDWPRTHSLRRNIAIATETCQTFE